MAYIKSRLTSAQVDELCNAKDLDPSDKNNRQKVSLADHRDHYDEWVKAGSGAEPNQQTPSRKRPHTVAVGDDQPTTPPTSSPKKGRLDNPWLTNMNDHDQLDGKAANTPLPHGETLTTST